MYLHKNTVSFVSRIQKHIYGDCEYVSVVKLQEWRSDEKPKSRKNDFNYSSVTDVSAIERLKRIIR